jgi:hypothetical protein
MLMGRLTWINVPRNDPAFVAFMQEVVSVLARPTPPLPGVRCAWCGV